MKSKLPWALWVAVSASCQCLSTCARWGRYAEDSCYFEGQSKAKRKNKM